jgi:hypothetical protein
MEEELLEIREFNSPGYQPVIDFEKWRVAILNFIEEIHPERIDFMERHNETDEVFVLIRGDGILFIGEGEQQIEKIVSQVMEAGKIYNVKQHVWHTVVLSRSGSVLIVENCNTSRDNSDYFSLDLEQRHLILKTAQGNMQDWE